MKTQRTTRYVSCIALFMALLAGNLQAQGVRPGPSFFEDFSDGNATDGSPVNWIPFVDTGGGTTGTIPGDLDGNYYNYRDLSISVRIKRISDHTNGQYQSGLGCRYMPGPTGGYWIEVRPPNRFLFGHRDRWILKSATLSFNIDETELIIRVDAVGDQLKAWCWPADEPMPEEPQISLVDGVAPEGVVSTYEGSQGGQTIFRWVKVESLDVPIVDFNGDGKVDIKDLLKMIRCWGQNEPSVDLVRDGTIDDRDLKILMDYWQQDVNDPTLTAHWAFDETQGDIALDSVGLTPGTVLGGAVWRPDAGQLAGALEFDGVDDAIVAGPVVDPSSGPFSVLAWVKGGAPGQVIFSQASGVNWLMADASQGLLKTELTSSGRLAGSLCCQTTIADGDWHRVALVCDGSNRILYVDDVAAAQDVQTNLTGSFGNLLIGAGSTFAPGTFWSGLIDEVRIYNRAVKP